jgi:hypothetical protein
MNPNESLFNGPSRPSPAAPDTDGGGFSAKPGPVPGVAQTGSCGEGWSHVDSLPGWGQDGPEGPNPAVIAGLEDTIVRQERTIDRLRGELAASKFGVRLPAGSVRDLMTAVDDSLRFVPPNMGGTWGYAQQRLQSAQSVVENLMQGDHRWIVEAEARQECDALVARLIKVESELATAQHAQSATGTALSLAVEECNRMRTKVIELENLRDRQFAAMTERRRALKLFGEAYEAAKKAMVE